MDYRQETQLDATYYMSQYYDDMFTCSIETYTSSTPQHIINMNKQWG
jgi:hypothetical protein